MVPKWPSAPFWPTNVMLFNNEGRGRFPGLLDTESIEKSQVVICPGRSRNNLFKRNPNTNLLAIRLDFNKVRGSEEAKEGGNPESDNTGVQPTHLLMLLAWVAAVKVRCG